MIALKSTLKIKKILNLDEVEMPQSPIVVGVILVYIATVFLQNESKISLRSIIWFTIAMAIHLLLHVFYKKLFKHRYWIYFVVQGMIIFNCAIIIPNGFEIIFLGLIPVLIFQSMIVYCNTIKIIITSIFFYSMFCGIILVFDGIEELIHYIPLFILITVAIRVYSVIFLRQVKLRIRTQKILQELELAYEKVEELTLINERQRMARDLHDTLSQGLAGLIMQLEAINTNLNNNNIKRAQEIIQKSMGYARKTLSNSRLVIDDLRFQPKADMDFNKEIENEIAQFKAVSNAYVIKNIKIESQIPLKIFEHILYILRESLNNIAKHSKAKKAIVYITEKNNQIVINISDDGIGFNVKRLDRQFGHYGILGMNERVKAIDGKLKIKSKRNAGTNLEIIIPIKKGIYNKNEGKKNIDSR